MLRPVKDHDPSICTHRGNDIGILRLVSRFVHFTLVVDFLYDGEFDLDI